MAERKFFCTGKEMLVSPNGRDFIKIFDPEVINLCMIDMSNLNSLYVSGSLGAMDLSKNNKNLSVDLKFATNKVENLKIKNPKEYFIKEMLKNINKEYSDD